MSSIEKTQAYYEGPVEAIYRAINGDILHLAMFRGDESRQDATDRTKRFLASRISPEREDRIIDLGSGYGNSARYLARNLGCQVIGVNIAHNQNVFANNRNKNSEFRGSVFVVEGDFASAPLTDGCARVVWSQEAFLHAPDRRSVVGEAYRLLAQDGELIFTDILRLKHLKAKEAEEIFERVKIDSMETFNSYRGHLQDSGFRTLEIVDLSEFMADSYRNHVEIMHERREKLAQAIDKTFIDRTINAMEIWIQAAEDGKLGWGMFHAKKS